MAQKKLSAFGFSSSVVVNDYFSDEESDHSSEDDFEVDGPQRWSDFTAKVDLNLELVLATGVTMPLDVDVEESFNEVLAAAKAPSPPAAAPAAVRTVAALGAPPADAPPAAAAGTVAALGAPPVAATRRDGLASASVKADLAEERNRVCREFFAEHEPPQLPEDVLVGGVMTRTAAMRYRANHPCLTWDDQGRVFCLACSYVYSRDGAGLFSQGDNIGAFVKGGITAKTANDFYESVRRHEKGSKKKEDANGIPASVHARCVTKCITAGNNLLGNAKETARLKAESDSELIKFIRFVHMVMKRRWSFLDAEDVAAHLEIDERLATRKLIAEASDMIGLEVRKSIAKDITDNKTYFSLIIDESTSASQKSMLIVHLRYFVQTKVENVFFDILELKSACANGILAALKLSLTPFLTEEFLRKRLIAVTADGASVMQGHLGGVVQLVRNWLKNPDIVSWNCLIHQLELCVKNAVKKRMAMDGFIKLLAWVKKYYGQPKNLRGVREIAKKSQFKFIRVGRIFDVRWTPSTTRAVLSMWKSLPVIVEHLRLQALNKVGDVNELKSAILKLTSHKFVRSLAGLIDITKLVTLSTLALQSRDVNVVESMGMLQRLANDLDRMAGDCGDFMKSARQTCEASRFGNIRLHAGGDFDEVNHGALISDITKAIRRRLFDPNPNSVLCSCLDLLSKERFAVYCSQENRNSAYGQDQLEYLSAKFGMNIAELKEAFALAIESPHQPWTKGVHDVVRLVDTFSSTSAESERGFSEMNRVLTDERTRLKSERLSLLMQGSLATANSWYFNPHRFLGVFRARFVDVLRAPKRPRLIAHSPQPDYWKYSR